jgi:hypothetical protein
MALDLDAFLEKTYGFPEETWTAARDWLTHRLQRVAGERGTVAYGELCEEMHSKGIIDLDPHGAPLAGLLGQVNVLEHDAGNPLISAVVVSKDAMEPGVGFWNIAKDLGIEFGDSPGEREAFWVQSLNECYARWQP